MRIERTKNTINGTIFGIVLKVITIVFPFAIRTIFIKLIGAEYLGLNSLFSSVLQVLNLAELGVGGALVFSMYKPIIEDDDKKICALMKLYRTYYRIIGLVILVLGLMISPFLNLFIKGEIPSDINIYIIYYMQLLATVLSYWLFAYRNCLFQAFQRTDIVSIITIIINLCLYAVQIICLLIWKNYYLYLGISIVFQILSNVVTAVVSKRTFPRYNPEGYVDKDEVKEINNKVKSLFTAKIGSVVAQSFDALVISAFMGLTALAIYQNYFYIFSSVYAMIMVIFSSSQAGIGNYLLTHDEKNNRELFYIFNYVTAFIAAIGCCCFLNLYQPFMELWVGKDYMLTDAHVVLLVIYFFVYLVLRPFCVFKDSAGMWQQDKFRPLASALFNLTLNIVTVRYIGLYGVIGSTICAVVFVSMPWVIININRNMFHLNVLELLAKELGYAIITVLCCILTWFVSSLISTENVFVLLLIRLLVSIVIPIILFGSVYYKSDENAYIMSHWRGLLKGRM